MRRKRKLPPDTRPKWDDPLDQIQIGNYWYNSGELTDRYRLVHYKADGTPKYDSYRLQYAGIKPKHWKNDPSYHWAEQAQKHK